MRLNKIISSYYYSIIAELSDMGLTMGEAEVIAQDRKRWRNDSVALIIIIIIIIV